MIPLKSTKQAKHTILSENKTEAIIRDVRGDSKR